MTFTDKLKLLGFSSYDDYIRSNHWVSIREKFKQSTLFEKRCFICGENRYQIHHASYERLGNECIKTDLLPVCKYHHERLHKFFEIRNFPIQLNYLRESIKFVTKWNNSQMVKFLARYLPFIFTEKELLSEEKSLTWGEKFPYSFEKISNPRNTSEHRKKKWRRGSTKNKRNKKKRWHDWGANKVYGIGNWSVSKAGRRPSIHY